MAILFGSNSGSSIPRTISTIIIGGVFLFIPGLTMKTVMIVMGSMLLLSGVITLIVSYIKSARLQKGFSSVQGISNMLFGMIFILAPSAMIKIFMVFIGVILLIMGFLQLAGALGSRSRSFWAWIFLTLGLLTFGSGLFLLSDPFKSAETILPFLGVLLILNGVSDLFKTRRKGAQPKNHQGNEIHDIPYEEV